MAPSSLRRVAGLAIVAAAAGLVVTPPTQAAPSTRAVTSISIRVVDPTVRPGHSGRVDGHLVIRGDAIREGRTVTLEAKPLGSTGFLPVAESLTAARGGLTATVTPEVTTRYRWRYAGDTDTRPSHSGVATIRVRTGTGHHPHRINTSLSVRAVHRATTDGIVDVVRGRLRAGRVSLGHRPVMLLGRTDAGAGWTFEGTALTDRKGVVRFDADPATDTAYRLAFLGTALLQPARSGVVRVVARPDVAIAADPTAITRGDATTITGTVTVEGSPAAGVTVKLWRVRAGHPRSHRVIGTAVTADDGTAVFTDSPKRTSGYQLRALPGSGSHAALSPVLRVTVSPAAQTPTA